MQGILDNVPLYILCFHWKEINSLEILGFSIIFGPETKFAISQDVAVQYRKFFFSIFMHILIYKLWQKSSAKHIFFAVVSSENSVFSKFLNIFKRIFTDHMIWIINILFFLLINFLIDYFKTKKSPYF